MSDNFVPEFPDVDCQEINLILVQVDMRAVDLLTSAIEADETLAAIQDPPCSYKTDPAEDDLDFQPYNSAGEDTCNQHDDATFLFEEFGIRF